MDLFSVYLVMLGFQDPKFIAMFQDNELQLPSLGDVIQINCMRKRNYSITLLRKFYFKKVICKLFILLKAGRSNPLINLSALQTSAITARIFNFFIGSNWNLCLGTI